MGQIGLANVVIAAAILLAQQLAGAATFYVTDLGTLGGASSGANGINNSGQVVGQADTADGLSHAFLYSAGRMSDLGTFGGRQSFASAINDAGQVVGGADVIEGALSSHAFLYSEGTMVDLGTLGQAQSFASGINSAGEIVGTVVTYGSDYNYHAFLYGGGATSLLGISLGGADSTAVGINDAEQIVGSATTAAPGTVHAILYGAGMTTDLGTPGGPFGTATGINSSGAIVGYGYTSVPVNGSYVIHGFTYSGGMMTVLDTLGGYFSYGLGINDAGEIVGESTTSNGPYNEFHAFEYSHGTLTDLNTLIPDSPGWSLRAGRGINNAGQMVGEGNIAGQQHAFLLTPLLCSDGVVGSARLTVTKVVPPTGSEHALNFRGTFTVSSAVGPTLDPVTNGFALHVADQGAVVLAADLPAGSFDQITRAGWKVNRAGTKWTFSEATPSMTAGITKLALTDKSAVTPGLVKFRATGKASSYSIRSTAVEADVILPQSGQCFATTWPATAPKRPSCTIRGTTLLCK
jgi:probable HAF family extracellular repeat protein